MMMRWKVLASALGAMSVVSLAHGGGRLADAFATMSDSGTGAMNLLGDELPEAVRGFEWVVTPLDDLTSRSALLAGGGLGGPSQPPEALGAFGPAGAGATGSGMTVVPGPGALGAIGIGLILAGGRRRRR